MAKKKFKGAYGLAGGAVGDLDAEPIANLADLDAFFVQTDGVFYPYSFDAAATNAEASPRYIRPDDYSTAGVHVLQSIGCSGLDVQGEIDFGTGSNAYPSTPTGFAIVGRGSVSNYRLSIADGSGRANHYWNAYYESGHKYVVDNEEAVNFEIGAGTFQVFTAPDSGGSGAGTSITWNHGYLINSNGNMFLNGSDYNNNDVTLKRTESANAYVYADCHSETNSHAINFVIRRSRGTGATPLKVENNNAVSKIIAQGYDGSTYRNHSMIITDVDGNPSSDSPGRLEFHTVTAGGYSLSEKMRITNAGKVGIGITPTTALHVDSNAADTTAITTLENTGGNVQQFVSSATPEGAITGSIGDLTFIDTTKGAVYIKETGTSTNTGWEPVSTKGLVLQVGTTILDPADASTYYAGAADVIGWTATAALQRIYIPKAGTVTKVYFSFIVITSAGTSETSTLSFRLNNTTDTTIDSSVDNSGQYFGSNTGLSIAVSAGDYFELKWVTPTWATNPLGVLTFATVYIE